MRFHLHHRRLDSSRCIDILQLLQADIRKSDCPALAVVHEIFQRSPSIKQSHVAVVNHIAVLIPWILLVPRLKCKRSVDQIEIQILDPESLQASLESRFDALRPVIRIPKFSGNKNLFARNSANSKSSLKRLANLALIPITLRAIKMSESRVQCVSRSTDRQSRVRNQSPKPKRRH